MASTAIPAAEALRLRFPRLTGIFVPRGLHGDYGRPIATRSCPEVREGSRDVTAVPQRAPWAQLDPDDCPEPTKFALIPDSHFSWVLQVKMVEKFIVFDSANHNPIIRWNYDTLWAQGALTKLLNLGNAS